MFYGLIFLPPHVKQATLTEPSDESLADCGCGSSSFLTLIELPKVCYFLECVELLISLKSPPALFETSLILLRCLPPPLRCVFICAEGSSALSTCTLFSADVCTSDPSFNSSHPLVHHLPVPHLSVHHCSVHYPPQRVGQCPALRQYPTVARTILSHWPDPARSSFHRFMYSMQADELFVLNVSIAEALEAPSAGVQHV